MPRPSGPVADGDRSDLLARLAAQLGSQREASWIVEHAEHAEHAEHGEPVEDVEHVEVARRHRLGRPSGDVRCSADQWMPTNLDRVGRSLDPPAQARAQALADRRAAGEPLQYVLGRWPFRSLELLVDPRVLIPRPETEQLVEVALAELGRGRSAATAGHDLAERVGVDLGTGSGAIALSLASEGPAVRPGLRVWATDASADALVVARANAGLLGAVDPMAAARLRLVEGSWFDALSPELAGQVDLLVSNPPYVGESEYPGLDPVVRQWEPRAALVTGRGAGGVDGMAAIEAIIAGAPRWLRRSGSLVLEISPAQAYASLDAARRAGFCQVTTERDLAGRLRVLVARR